MEIIFGKCYDDGSFEYPELQKIDKCYLGLRGLVRFLAERYGLFSNLEEESYLRLAYYRRAIKQYLDKKTTPNPFFAKSFQSDEFSTTTDLLDRRDELKLAGWTFITTQKTPPALISFAELEAEFQEILEELDTNLKGFADLQIEVEELIGKRKNPITQLKSIRPIPDLPPSEQRLLKRLGQNGTIINTIDSKPIPQKNTTDLSHFQRFLSAPDKIETPVVPNQDGSIVLLKGQNENALAQFTAKILANNKTLRPGIVLPTHEQTLDIAMNFEGLPNLGLAISSAARPSLQVLKLVANFVWSPINPVALLEFVTLRLKPLHPILAFRISSHLSQYPGIKGATWYQMINDFFTQMEENEQVSEDDIKEAKFQYKFWFDRSTYPQHLPAPKSDFIEIFEYLANWGFQHYKDQGEKDQSLRSLSHQANKVAKLLKALPEKTLDQLSIEQIVKTIFEPSRLLVQDRQVDALPVSQSPEAWPHPIPQMLWWNFIDQQSSASFPRWNQQTVNYLLEQNLNLPAPTEKLKYELWAAKKGIFNCEEQLILVIPQKIENEEVNAHPLLGMLEVCFGDLDAQTIDISPNSEKPHWIDWENWPTSYQIEPVQHDPPKHFLHLPMPFPSEDDIQIATPTQLENFLFYPHQWFFKNHLKIRPLSLFQIAPKERLMGNLAHRFFEKLLENPIVNISKETLEEQVEEMAKDWLPKEGATLLQYGQEAERIQFLRTVKKAAWTLITLINDNGWKIKATEARLEGPWHDLDLRGRADLILERGKELALVDLKWSGSTFRKNLIKNEEDLQLNLYSKILHPDQWVHSAFFIIKNGKMIARNRSAFKEAEAITPNADAAEVNDRIEGKMIATLSWRKRQIAQGKVEVRCTATTPTLEAIYENENLFDLLEMKRSDDRFEPFTSIIGLVE